MRSRLLALAALALPGCLAHYDYPPLVARAPGAPPPLLFRDVRLFAATGPEAVEHQDVAVVGGRISSVSPTGTVPPPAGARVIDGVGRTLLPGLVDFHVHLTGAPSTPWAVTLPDADFNGRALLRAGITYAVDTGGSDEDLLELVAREQSGEWLGPRFRHAGRILTREDGYPRSMIRGLLSWPFSSVGASLFAEAIESPAEATAAVNAHLDAGANHIKVAVAQVPLATPVLTREILDAVVAAAHRRGRR